MNAAIWAGISAIWALNVFHFAPDRRDRVFAIIGVSCGAIGAIAEILS